MNGRTKIALLAALCAVAAGLVVTGAVLGRHADRVATVDGHDVTRAELVFHLKRVEPAVQNELHLTGAWYRSALDTWKARALAEVERDKTVWILAREQGLVGSVDYDGFLAEMAAENKRRADAVAHGEVVYGVTAFTPDEYYSHRLTELTTALQKRLGGEGGPLSVTDAEVRAAFAADPAKWSANATTYTYSKLVVPVPAGAPAGFPAGLQRRVTAAKRLAQVASAQQGATLTKATYGGGDPAGLNTHDQDLVAVLGTLAPGQISAPVAGTGQITYYELDGRAVDEKAALAAYAGRIRQALVAAKFDQYLQRRVDGSDIKVDASAVAAITAEDVT